MKLQALGILFFSLSSFAEREILLPPIYYATVTGAVVCTSPAPNQDYQQHYDLLSTIIAQTSSPAVPPASPLPRCREIAFCSSANMTGEERLSNNGISCSNHNFSIMLTNLADINQTVTVTLRKQSKFSTARNSKLIPGMRIPDAPGNTLILDNDISETKKLSPAGSLGETQKFTFGPMCDGSDCSMAGCLNESANVCLQQASQAMFGIKVAEDRGAVQGIVSYRAGGSYSGTVTDNGETLVINGGRPF